MAQRKHLHFSIGLLVALVAGASAGIVASVMLARSLGDYTAELLASHVPTASSDATPRSTPSSIDDAVVRVAEIAGPRVATIVAASIDARMPSAWVAESDAVAYGVVVAADGWVLTTDEGVKAFANPMTQADVWIEGTRHAVTQVVKDELTDFVLLKIDATGLTPAAFGASESVQDGSMVYVARGTHGIEVTSLADDQAGEGVQSEPAEAYAFSWELAQSPRVSSPVFSAAGDVIALSESAGTLPVHTGSTFVRAVLRDGVVSHAGLGAYLVDLSLPLNMDAAMSQGRHEGALVVAPMLRTSPAVTAGVLVGDIITAVDDVRVDAGTSVAELLRLYRPGDRATLTVLRDGASQRIDVTLGTYGDLVY